jgi:predicted SAM-dependent methyltransferase
LSLLRSTIELTNRVMAQLKAKRRVAVPAGFESVRLNLGCGLAVTKGWINIDGSLNALVASMPAAVHRLMYRLTGAKAYYSEDEYCRLLDEHVFIHHDLALGIPLGNGVADYIFSSHFFEHLYQKEAAHLLQDSHRVLKEGGLLRISIPDLEYAIGLYAGGSKEQMLKSYFFVEDGGNVYSRHKYMYDFEMLSALLGEIGFREITRHKFQEGDLPDISLLDNRPEDSLFVEARK